jgi:hypothetical protein
LISDADIQAGNMRPRSGANAKEKTAMVNNDMAITEISDTELDWVSAGASGHSLVNVNVPINIAVGLQGQTNISVFSLATQGGANTLVFGLLSIA